MTLTTYAYTTRKQTEILERRKILTTRYPSPLHLVDMVAKGTGSPVRGVKEVCTVADE
jgi:hypothetical protein